MESHNQSSTVQTRPPSIDSFSYWAFSLSPEFPLLHDLRLMYRFVGSNLPRPHIHNCFEIGYCHKGKGLFKIGNKLLPYKSSDIAVISRSEAHMAHFVVDCVWSWLYLDPAKLLASSSLDMSLADTNRFEGDDFVNIISSKEHPEAESLLLHIIRELEEEKSFYRNAVRGLTVAFMACLHRTLAPGMAPAGRMPALADPIGRIGPALEYMQSQYKQKLAMETIAKQANMSLTNFNRIFRKALGVSPHKYIAAFRINMACAALKGTTKTVETIAYETGFEDPSAFSRAFKESTGTAPGQWRKRFSSNH
jgi:AraC-like DNA-binding protein